LAGRQKSQWNGIEPKINPHVIWLNDLQQECQDHTMGKVKTLQQWYWENSIPTCKRMNKESWTLHSLQKLIQMDQRPNVRSKSIKHEI
jgi:hypothetical protein